MNRTHFINWERARCLRFGAAAIACLGLACFALPTAAQSIEPIHSFTGPDGDYPTAGLTLGPDGNLYGTTVIGGSDDRGTVFRITTGGTLTTLHSFSAIGIAEGFTNTDGVEPQAGLIVGSDGNNLYGTASGGGSSTYGTVFQITTNGALTTLANFAKSNGAAPWAGLAVDQAGNLFGTTQEGGSAGYGTVFRVATNGALTILASFNKTNGEYPFHAALTMGPDGNFYGTTEGGGSSNSGTVFRITTNGTLTTLHSFSGSVYGGGIGVYSNVDGALPQAGLTLGPDGNLYGTTAAGGSRGNGTIFQISTKGTLTVLHSFGALVYVGSADFTNADGAFPQAGLEEGPDGNFYGTTVVGGSNNGGTVFKMSTNGSLTILASFTAGPDYTNATGFAPLGSLTLGPDGNFYGTTSGGGNADYGGIYRLNLPPSIITQPSSQIVFAGSNPIFTLTLFGTAPFGYQWLYNATPIVDATNSTLTITDAMPSSAGNYQVIVTNTWGSVTSSVAALSVLTGPPMITNQPASESVPIGGTANFAVGATGTPPLAYQWYFSRQQHAHSRTQPQEPLPGATNTTLSFGPVHPNQDGNYQVLITGPYGSATSDVASLTVLLRPNFYAISNSTSGTVTLLLASIPGSTNRLWATTNLSLPFAQWQPISTNVADTTGLFQFTDTNTGNGPAKFYILTSP